MTAQSHISHFMRNFLFQWNLFTSHSNRIETKKELLPKHKNGTSAVLRVNMILQITYREATKTRKIVIASLLIVQRKELYLYQINMLYQTNLMLQLRGIKIIYRNF